MEPTRDSALAALKKLTEPVTGMTLEQAKMLKDVVVEGDSTHVTIELPSPTTASRAPIESAIRDTLTRLGARRVEVTFVVNVRTRQISSDDPCPQVKNVILVMSGKGGVGKSTVAVNLAMALHRAGARVGLLDADIYGPSIPTMMGIHARPISTDGKLIEPLDRFGMKLMSIGFLLDDPKTAVVWRGPMLHGALQQFLKDVNWGKLDYLVLDLPPGTGDVALTLSQRVKVTGVVIVTTPQEVALMDVYKAISMCHKLDLPILGVVENMSYFVDPTGQRHEIFGRGGGAKAAEFAGAPLLGQIPMDALVREWGDNGTPVVQARPDSSVAKVFSEIAEKLCDQITLALNKAHGGVAPTDMPKRLPVVR